MATVALHSSPKGSLGAPTQSTLARLRKERVPEILRESAKRRGKCTAEKALQLLSQFDESGAFSGMPMKERKWPQGVEPFTIEHRDGFTMVEPSREYHQRMRHRAPSGPELEALSTLQSIVWGYARHKAMQTAENREAIYRAISYWVDNVHLPTPQKAHMHWAYPRTVGGMGVVLFDDIERDRRGTGETAELAEACRKALLYMGEYAWHFKENCKRVPLDEKTLIVNSGAFTGANFSYRLPGLVNYALLVNEEAAFDEIVVGIALSLRRVDQYTDMKTNGLTADGVNRHHGPQTFIFGYGTELLKYTLGYARFVRGTRWDLDESQYERLAEYVAGPLQAAIYKGQGDYLASGKHNLTPGSYRGYGKLVQQYAARILPHLSQDSACRSKLQDLVSSEDWDRSDTHRYYWNNDYMIQRRRDYYLSVGMISDRTCGAEDAPGKAKCNFHNNDGTTLIYVRGDEYAKARVGWNFRALPGTTCEQLTEPLPPVLYGGGNFGNNAFCGGVSDGRIGVCGFVYSKDRTRVAARKSYFMLEGMLIAAGSHIRRVEDRTDHVAEPAQDILTTINQNERSSAVFYTIGNSRGVLEPATNERIVSPALEASAWVHHGETGYLVFAQSEAVVELTCAQREGDWNNLDDRSPPGSTETVSMFQLSLNHGQSPQGDSYAYAVLPAITKDAFASYLEEARLPQVKTTDDVHFVFDESKGVLGAVFYDPGTITLPDGMVLESKTPGIYLVQGIGTDALTVASGNPLPWDDSCHPTLRVNRRLTGEWAKEDGDGAVIQFPVEADFTLRGRTLSTRVGQHVSE